MADDILSEDSRVPTHTAFALKREGKDGRFGRWLEIGAARAGRDGVMHLFLDRLPIGGFSGYVYVSPAGKTPPLPEPRPQRSAQPSNGEDETED